MMTHLYAKPRRRWGSHGLGMPGSDLGGLGFGGCRRSCLGGSRFEGRGFWILEGRLGQGYGDGRVWLLESHDKFILTIHYTKKLAQ